MADDEENGALAVVTLFTVKPEHVSTVGALLRDLVTATGKEPGCVQYEALQSQADAEDFAVVGEWRSESAYDAHMAAPHTTTFTHRVLGLLSSGPEIRRYKAL
jgi:quinol monooxygenase YgiN